MRFEENTERLRLLELLAENTQDFGLLTLDTQGQISSWNTGAVQIFGYTEEEALGQDTALIFTPEDREQGAHKREQQTALTEGRAEDERYHLRKNGTRFYASGVLTCLRDEQGELHGFAKILRDLTARKHAEEERLALLREATLLAERNRMARELHDTLAQGYTAIIMQMNLAADMLNEPEEDRPEALAPIARAREIAAQSLLEARRSVLALRSSLLEGGSLVSAFQQMAERIPEGTQVEFITEGTYFALPAEVENDLYRIGQESLTNALRHSRAAKIQIHLTYAVHQVSLHIADDGQGFHRSGKRAGFGLIGMQERAERLGAQLQIDSQPGQGTRTNVLLPVIEKEPHDPARE